MISMNPPAAGGVTVGDVLSISDTVTGFSSKNVMRWWFVAAITGFSVRIVPRSATARGGVFTPASSMPEFTKDGWFRPMSLPLALVDALACRNIGQLSEPYRTQVLAQSRRRRRR